MVVKTGIPEVDKALKELSAAIEKLEKHPISNGVFVSGSITASLPTRFVHGFKRPWRGWFVTRRSTDATPYETTVAGTDKSRELWLTAGSDVELEVYIF